MAGWWASLSRRVRRRSASSFHSGARGTGGRGMLVSMLVYSSRVDVWGSMMGELVADGLSDGVFV